MSYSTHSNLKEIYADIDKYLASVSVPVFSGAALNDLVVSGDFAGAADKDYVVKIDGTGSPDTFKWSDDGGATFVATNVPITGEAQLLSNGISVTFGATTGHSTNDQWTFTCTAACSDDQRAFAYDWLNDRLRSMYDVPFSSPSKSVILAEAYYAAYIILLANDNAYASSFLAQAESLVSALSFDELEDESNASTCQSTTMLASKTFTVGQRDSDGNLIGDAGVLDDF